MNTTIMNKVELSDEMLAQVNGGNSVKEPEEKHGDFYFDIPQEVIDEIRKEVEREKKLEELNKYIREITPKFCQ